MTKLFVRYLFCIFGGRRRTKQKNTFSNANLTVKAWLQGRSSLFTQKSKRSLPPQILPSPARMAMADAHRALPSCFLATNIKEGPLLANILYTLSGFGQFMEYVHTKLKVPQRSGELAHCKNTKCRGRKPVRRVITSRSQVYKALLTQHILQKTVHCDEMQAQFCSTVALAAITLFLSIGGGTNTSEGPGWSPGWGSYIGCFPCRSREADLSNQMGNHSLPKNMHKNTRAKN